MFQKSSFFSDRSFYKHSKCSFTGQIFSLFLLNDTEIQKPTRTKAASYCHVLRSKTGIKGKLLQLPTISLHSRKAILFFYCPAFSSFMDITLLGTGMTPSGLFSLSPELTCPWQQCFVSLVQQIRESFLKSFLQSHRW